MEKMKLGNFRFWVDSSSRFWVRAVLWNLYTTLAHASSELFPPQVPSADWPNQPTSGPYITSGGEIWWYFPLQGGGGICWNFPLQGTCTWQHCKVQVPCRGKCYHISLSRRYTRTWQRISSCCTLSNFFNLSFKCHKVKAMQLLLTKRQHNFLFFYTL